MTHTKRRTFSAGFKFETVMEALRGEKTAAQICPAPGRVLDAPFPTWPKTSGSADGHHHKPGPAGY